MTPATYAIIPDFLRFRIGVASFEMGGAHGDYERLERSVRAPLIALPGQPIKSSPGILDKLRGRLLVVDAEDRDTDWSSCIHRNELTEHSSDTADYIVQIDLTAPAFDRFAALMRAGSNLSYLSLDFQNIDGPLHDDPLDRPIPWDDMQFPAVALTNFVLRWT